jgi:hypothetical protein
VDCDTAGSCSDDMADGRRLSPYLRNAAWVLVTVVVSFWVGVLFAHIVPGLDEKPLKMLIDTAIAVGTIGAVVVALSQSEQGRRESRSRAYRDAAVQHLEIATDDFLNANALANGKPRNTRRHWLNFARAIQVSRRLSSHIELTEQREIWIEQENVFRQRVYDVLQPVGQSYSMAYYMQPAIYSGADELPLAEQSLVVIYGWVKWPADLPDPIDRKERFTDEQREEMRFSGPIGVADFIDAIRPPESHEIHAIDPPAA